MILLSGQNHFDCVIHQRIVYNYQNPALTFVSLKIADIELGSTGQKGVYPPDVGKPPQAREITRPYKNEPPIVQYSNLDPVPAPESGVLYRDVLILIGYRLSLDRGRKMTEDHQHYERDPLNFHDGYIE